MSSKKSDRLPVVTPELPFDFGLVELGDAAADADQLIAHTGVRVLLSHHIVCPCITSVRTGGTGTAIVDCPSCSGTGFAYLDAPDPCTATVQGTRSSDRHDPDGAFAASSITVTFQSSVEVAEGDMLQLYEASVPMRVSRDYKESVGGIRLPFDVLDVRDLVTNNRMLEIVRLKRGVDYTLNVDENLLVFPKDGKVRDGSTVSGVFLGSPYYIIDALLSSFRGQRTAAFSSDGVRELVRYPTSVTAVRSDYLNGRMQHEVTQKGSADKGEGS